MALPTLGAGLRRMLARRVCAALLLAAAALPLGAQEARACGAETPCAIADGDYHVAAPEGWNGASPLPVLVFFHGHRSDGRAVMRGGARKDFAKAGWLVVAPNGALGAGRAFRSWPARDMGEAWRDDVAFAAAVLADVAERFPVDRDRIVISGFSAGGSMAWRVACLEGGGLATAYAPIAGALRNPTSAAEGGCPGAPADILHFHGFEDVQVPIEGRAIRDWTQGDAFAALALARGQNGCASRPDALDAMGAFWSRDWTSCASGRRVGFRLHPGGHGVPAGWVQETLRWLAG